VCRRRKNNRSCSQEINDHSSHTALDYCSPIAVRASIPLYSILYNSSPLRVLPRYCTAYELVEEKTWLSRILSRLSLSNNTVLMYPDKRLLGRRRVQLAENIGIVLISVVGSQIRHNVTRPDGRSVPKSSMTTIDIPSTGFASSFNVARHRPCRQRQLPTLPPAFLERRRRPEALPSTSLGRQHDCCPGHHQRLEVLHTITLTVMYHSTASSFDITPKWLSLTTSL
jgi:hypothetical protein